MADSPNATCPIDHKSRAVFCPQADEKRTWSQTLSSYLWSSKASRDNDSGLDTNRVISSIPRAAPSGSNSPSACPVANAEVESGSAPDGKWVYPSEKMFFEAMRRKGYDPRAHDMKTVVPIHNAVNERAWAQICQWEAPYLQQSTCPGPKLESFSNKNDHLTPKARLNSILGYTPPFDRHDWVIDRCGTRVEYVIDFYTGRSDGKPGPSFYLDVRPKLNSWEGVKMRALGLIYMT
ncbi:hypothetical protein CP533_2524 [Ophiocordyceps camponoti-saundersi (nom. inval.)]|nr:hypothetical protein CP533_2524 [Ophiocordyceps camponoti-saundersi (nom. inval.)]